MKLQKRLRNILPIPYLVLNSDRSSSLSRKTVLAPFGEYYPFGILFPGFRNYLQTRSGALFFNRGDEIGIHRISDSEGKDWFFKTLICYETAYGDLLFGTESENTDFLVSISSDYWTGSAIALLQNAIFAKYRAVEYRLPIVRVSNGGLTGYVNATGRTWVPLPAFAEGMAHVNLVKHQHAIYKKQTPYSYCGDLILEFCIANCIILIIYLYLRKRRSFYLYSFA